MAGIKFVHAADLHLDTPFKVYNSNPQMRSKLKDALFKSFRNIINLCIEETVDFLAISGDIFDYENKSLAAQFQFVNEIKRLSEKNIPTYFICGNHDPLDSWIAELTLPENVYRFDSTQIQIEHFKKNGTVVADIYGISFPTKKASKNFALEFNKIASPAPISIALLHGTIGNHEGHENYAPFQISDVANKGFDYWALGHIHKRQIVNLSYPTIAYPGNPQGRDFGEQGSKGCFIVEIEEHSIPKTRFAPTNSIVFAEINITITPEDNIETIAGKISDAKTFIPDYADHISYILRVTIQGNTTLHSQLSNAEEIKNLIDYLNEDQLEKNIFSWIDKIEIQTKPAIDVESIRNQNQFPAALLAAFDALTNDKAKFTDLIISINDEFASYQAKKDLSEFTNEEQLKALEQAKWKLLTEFINV